MANTITFPEEMRGGNNPGLPMIQFKAKTQAIEVESVFLYIPQGLQFTDGASYTGIELGTINAARDVAQGRLNIAGDGAELANNNTALVAGLKLIDKIGVSPEVAAAAGIEKGVAFNPQTTLAFEQANLRQFQFSFNLVPESEKDSVNINKIEKFFRKYLYPEVTGFVAKYPPLFSIKFFDEGESDENPYFPMIHDCYLTGVDVTINPEGNSFYKTARGKAPASTTMALSFQESRLLSRHDIFKEGTLDYDPGRPNSSSIDAAGSSSALAKETSETSE